MQRRKFIKNSLLASLTLALGPTALWANNSNKTTQLFRLPTAQEHIRHGLFQHNGTAMLDGICQIQRDVFLNEKEGDLVHYSIQLEGCLLNLGIDKTKAYISTGTAVQNYLLEAKKRFDFTTNTVLEGSLLNLKTNESFEYHSSPKQEEAILIVIKGNVIANQDNLNTEQGLYIKTPQAISLESNTDSLLLVLSK